MRKKRSFSLLRRRIRSHRRLIAVVAAVIAVATIGYTVYMTQRRETVDIATYQPLLQLIGEAESKGNYNAYFGNAGNTRLRFTNMTVAEVLAWQETYIAEGNPSSAVGKYQIINTTLHGLTQRGVVSVNDIFSEATQDQLAVALLQQRGGEQYVNQELSAEAYAAELAKEWASLPSVVGDSPQKSYYESRLNRALVSPTQIVGAVNEVRAES